MSDHEIQAIDAVVNIFNSDALQFRPEWRNEFFGDKIGASAETVQGVELDEMLRRMDAAGIERGFLIPVKCGPPGPPSCFHSPLGLGVRVLKDLPDRFFRP